MADGGGGVNDSNGSNKHHSFHTPTHTNEIPLKPKLGVKSSESDSQISKSSTTSSSTVRNATNQSSSSSTAVPISSRSNQPHSYIFDQTDTRPITIKNIVNEHVIDTDIEINPIYKLTLRDEDSSDSVSSAAASDNGEEDVEWNCPRVNCPERIVICIDISSEMEKVSFKSRAGDRFTPMQLIKRALRFFVNSKSALDRRHSYALVVLQDSAFWMHDFTNDPNEMINLLRDLEGTQECETFDLTSLFELIKDQVQFPVVENSAIIPPPYIVRVVLLYGRSHCVPKFTSREAQAELRESPHFFLDVFYVHELPSNENHCVKIFDAMCELDDKGFSYVLEASRNPTRLYDCLAQLTAHPLQRPLQKDASYSINSALPQGLSAQQQSQYATL